MPDAEQIFAVYGDRLRRRKVSKTALREYRIVTDAFMSWLRDEGKEIDEVRRPDIEDFFAGTGWAPNTQRARITWLRAPWSYAIEELEIPLRYPFRRVELEKPVMTVPKTLTGRELRAIFKLPLNEADEATMCLLAFQGMRSIECRRLEWTGVSFADQTLRFMGKGDRERMIPMHPRTQEALSRLGVFAKASGFVLAGQSGQMMAGSGFWTRVHRISGRAGVEAAPHDFRRTVATSLERNGARVGAIKQLMGWSSGGDIRLEFYTSYSMATLMEDLLKIYSDDPV